jgi:hypothetical protein
MKRLLLAAALMTMATASNDAVAANARIDPACVKKETEGLVDREAAMIICDPAKYVKAPSLGWECVTDVKTGKNRYYRAPGGAKRKQDVAVCGEE